MQNLSFFELIETWYYPVFVIVFYLVVSYSYVRYLQHKNNCYDFWIFISAPFVFMCIILSKLLTKEGDE